MLAKGSFCRFFCDGLDGTGRDGTGWYVARFARYTRYRKGEGGKGGGEFWERVHVLNRLVRDGAGRQNGAGAFFPRYFARYVG